MNPIHDELYGQHTICIQMHLYTLLPAKNTRTDTWNTVQTHLEKHYSHHLPGTHTHEISYMTFYHAHKLSNMLTHTPYGSFSLS